MEVKIKMQLEKKVLAKTASLGFLALSLAAIPLICDNGCKTLSKNELNQENMSLDIKYAQLEQAYAIQPASRSSYLAR